ncbi:hypothetical protein [Flavitalea sp.]|nr:hypothetical protein [Flavitalea sp.]
MQHLNDDMDEMFRKAADDYPLNTGNPDWNKVAEGLSQEKNPEPPVKRSYRKYTWLLLLLPFAFICNRIYDPGLFKQITNSTNSTNSTHGTNGTNSNEVEMNKNKSKDQPNLKDREPGSEGQEPGLDDKELRLDEKEPGSEKNNGKAGQDPNVGVEGKPLPSETSRSPVELSAPLNKGRDQSSKARKIPTGQPTLSNSRYRSSGNGISQKNKTSDINRKTSNPKSSALPGTTNTGAAINSSLNESPAPDFYAIYPYTKTGLALFDMTPEVSTIPVPEMTKLSPGPVSKHPVKNKNFYVGFVGGIDMTTVSFQQTSKIGSQFGGLAGYSFAKKWSVELGFFVDKKYYYSDAKHFEKGKLPYRANATVLSVDGSCRMFEIPVSFKYDITNTYKSNFFVTGGLSSYIMKNEDYDILYLYNSSGSKALHPYSYKNSSTNLFSEIRITGGYSLKLPKSFSVRIEPYFNIPVSGVGHGDLNLMSGGINAGIFRRIF